MVDQERLEFIQRVAVAFVERNKFNDEFDDILPPQDFSDLVIKYVDAILEQAEGTSRVVIGHPAETALEQLLALIADHHDKHLPKWIAANAKHRKLGELVSYLGADIETP